MKKQRCHVCGKPAFAYRIEAGGAKTYFCLAHLPDGEAPHYGDKSPSPPSPPPPAGKT
jgi:hypothetical protein